MSDTTMTGPVTYYYMPCPMCPASNPNHTGFQNCLGHAAPLPDTAFVPAHNPLACPCCRAAGEIEAERDAVLSAAADRLTQAEERIADLTASLAECARWLLDYGQHTPRCPVPHAAWHSTGETCTCGLDDLVQRAEALLKEKT